MANISFKNKKFPIKAVPTVGIALLVACAIVFLSEFFLRDNVRQLNLSDFELNEIDYEFQKILESENYEIQESGLEAISQNVTIMLNPEVLEQRRLHKVKLINY